MHQPRIIIAKTEQGIIIQAESDMRDEYYFRKKAACQKIKHFFEKHNLTS